ncbi:C6 zinc finger domain protein [Paraphaeosphaeria minitans]|uniref:C6 zinc finger domain protein n=1 Tax=Paraphaeosphaeria minitans TaxID=565426 RepID=A0A9P6GSU3_9PLEO|nr:C6 zinc finger domain protein [Paraphaeosphaeria minitans]
MKRGDEGLEMYDKALSLFAQELNTPGKAKPFEVLNCCRILALYDQLNDISAEASNWKGHVQGLLTLIHQHPPKAFSHTGAHEIFLECRHNGVTSALANRQATYFSKPEWIIRPWKSRHKNVVDTASDILVKISGDLEEWDPISTRTSTEEVLRKVKVFRHQCARNDHELRRSERELEKVRAQNKSHDAATNYFQELNAVTSLHDVHGSAKRRSCFGEAATHEEIGVTWATGKWYGPAPRCESDDQNLFLSVGGVDGKRNKRVGAQR